MKSLLFEADVLLAFRYLLLVTQLSEEIKKS